MTTKEIENLTNNLAEEYERFKDELTVKNYIKRVIEITNLHWQEKTRWKSLIKEPPHHYPKRYFLRMGLNGEPRSMPFLSNNSLEEYIDYGFTEWKEIE